MIKITRHNYESFFIDYIDGSLSAAEQAELMAFLEQNADLAEELEGIRRVMLEAKPNEYGNKEELKRVDHTQLGIKSRVDYLCIAELENDISPKEEEELSTIISKSKENKLAHSLYQKLKLTPDKTISYSQKQSLKRIGIGSISLQTLVRATSVAASLGLLIGIVTLIRVSPVIDSAQIAQQEEFNHQNQTFQEATPQGLDQMAEQELVKGSTHFDMQEAPFHQTPEYEETTQPTDEQELERVVFNAIAPISTQKLNVENYLANINPNLVDIRTDNKTLDEAIITQEQPPLYAGTSRTIGVFEIAQLGVQRLSDFTGANVNLDGDKDGDGNLKKIHFQTNLFAVSVPIKRK